MPNSTTNTQLTGRSKSMRRSRRPSVLVLLVIVVIGGLGASLSSGGGLQPSDVAIADIPTNYLVEYERVAMRFGLDWSVLAAIGELECDHGRSRAAGCNPPGTTNAA